jgi:hypothetical protein
VILDGDCTILRAGDVGLGGLVVRGERFRV